MEDDGHAFAGIDGCLCQGVVEPEGFYSFDLKVNSFDRRANVGGIWPAAMLGTATGLDAKQTTNLAGGLFFAALAFVP